MLTFQIGLLAINVVVVMFISIFIYFTTQQILHNYDARDFLDGVVAIPWRPYDKIWQCMLLLLILIISFAIREFVFPNNNKVVIATLACDMIAIMGILYVQGFNYNGILLLVFANIIGNIVIFIPLPMLLSGLTGRLLRWIKLFGIGLLTLICLEIIQLLTRRGACDVDDVLLNMTGILLGYLIVRIYARKKYGIPVHNKEHVKPEMKQDLD